MKKVFNIDVENKTRPRQVDSIKNEIRKYIKREKSKKLPEGFNFWHFDSRFGTTLEDSKEILFQDIIKSVDFALEENFSSFYLEIVSKPLFKELKEAKDEKNESDIIDLQ